MCVSIARGAGGEVRSTGGPASEPRRIDARPRHESLDAPPDAAVEQLVALAARTCNAERASIVLADTGRTWCAYPVADSEEGDLREPATPPFATAAVVTPAGEALGTLAVIDREPRAITELQLDALRTLATSIGTHLEWKRQESERARTERTLAESLREQQQIEETLRGSEHRYRMLFTHNPSPMWVFDLESLRFLAVNRAAVERYGYSESEFLSMKITDIRNVEELPVLEAAIERARRGEREAATGRHRVKDGRIIDVEVSGDTVEVDGRLARLVVVHDISARRAAEQLRRESDERYAMVVRASTAGLWDWKLGSNTVFYSSRFKELLGYSDEEFPNDLELFNEALHPDDRAAFKRALDRHFATPGSTFDMEYRLRSRTGAYRWINARGQAMWDERGKPYRMTGSVIDVTDRRLAAEALRESEERFRLLSKATNDAIRDWDLVTDTLWWNDAYFTLFGYTREDTPAGVASWRDRIDPNDRDRVGSRIRQAIDSGAESWWDEYRFVRADGSQAYVLDRAYVIRDASGHALRMIGSMTDLTSRREAEEQIAAQAALLNEAQDAILLTDLDHRVLFWNHGAERLYGWSAGEAVGAVDTDLHEVDSPARLEAHNRMMEAGRWEGVLEQRTRSGDALMVESRWALTHDQAGRPKSILILSTDVTERKRNEARLLRAQRMESIGTLAGGIAHDLNNLLAPMMMSVDLLRETCTDQESLDLLKTVQVSAARGAELVQQVLSFARGVEGQRVPVSPVLLVQEVQKIIRDSFPKTIRVRVSLSDPVWSVLGDPTQLHQVLLNLCVNARDAMPEGGDLTIEAENAEIDDVYTALNPDAKQGDYVVIRVSDTGSGIAPDTRDRIFEPFFSTKEVGRGTGLGLSTSLAIVRSHGGFISLYSEPGVGTTFRVYLPATRAQSPSPEAPRSVASFAGGNGELVLLVDDESPIRQVAQRTLERTGYRVITAADGREAMSIYSERGGEIDLVLTDMSMPVMDGPTLIARLRGENPDVRIIASSGLSTAEGAGTDAGGRAVPFLPKPYTAETLLRVVRDALDGRAADRAS
jgi:PAS domain S-box-containing protein